MHILPIRTYPDPVLRVECAPVEAFDGELVELVENMVATMYDAPGVGLAAPQVGVERRLAVVDVTVGEQEGHLLVLVNPEIVSGNGSETDVEGCLSIPGLTEKVERPDQIQVRAQNIEGKPFEFEAEGFLARAICHEVDHLDGVLFVDRLVGLRKDRARRKLRRMAREAGVVEARS